MFKIRYFSLEFIQSFNNYIRRKFVAINQYECKSKLLNVREFDFSKHQFACYEVMVIFHCHFGCSMYVCSRAVILNPWCSMYVCVHVRAGTHVHTVRMCVWHARQPEFADGVTYNFNCCSTIDFIRTFTNNKCDSSL